MNRDFGLNWRRTASLSATLVFHLLTLALLTAVRPLPQPLPAEQSETITVQLIAEPHRIAGESSPRPREATPPPGKPAQAIPRPARIRTAAVQPRPSNAAEPAVVVQTPASPMRTPTTPNELPAPPAAFSGAPTASTSALGGGGLEHGGKGDAGASAGIRFATKTQPLMPRSMRGSKWSGYALIGLRIGADGKPMEVVVLRSSGVHEIDRTARLAAQRSTYVPHMTRGQPVEFWGVVPVVFGEATPDVERDLAHLAERWRASRRDTDAPATPRPAV